MQANGLYSILPRLLQRLKEYHGHYSTIYHATSQWIINSDLRNESNIFSVDRGIKQKWMENCINAFRSFFVTLWAGILVLLCD